MTCAEFLQRLAMLGVNLEDELVAIDMQGDEPLCVLVLDAAVGSQPARVSILSGVTPRDDRQGGPRHGRPVPA